MRSEAEIRETLEREIARLPDQGGHLASIARGWIDALEWVLGDGE